MGYLNLSCKAQSSISTSNSLSSSSSSSSKPNKDKDKEKTIKIQQFQYTDLEAATNNFSNNKLLGKGSHGYVYKAIVHGKPVAVKRPSRPQSLRPISSSSSSHEITNEVDNEIDILSKIQSPRIPPPKDAFVRKQLALIAAKCVRSCRERRPSMNELNREMDG
ncbi:hypothetical protein TSUD_268720 [Trifolium subterraneum]|uniref:Protein kinase domain-containing protein n=1 Tax=Trifolium subterraneum TaxID=3900 RepID=A0A2Z6P952_TRISU|nr:hypothetical protein TSUD_268720 [Trifolium subterraneum]